jgi:hypothetical protein
MNKKTLLKNTLYTQVKKKTTTTTTTQNATIWLDLYQLIFISPKQPLRNLASGTQKKELSS